MKKTFILTVLMLLSGIAARGVTIDVDSLRFTLNTDGTATVSSCLYQWTPNITIPQTVNDGTTDYTVTKIADYAFDGRTFITSVTFPETLEEMGYCSFRYCYGLTSLKIPASLKKFSSSNFSECKNLQTVTIADGSQMTKVDEAAFYNCNQLTSIKLPSTVTEIVQYAFYNCRSLSSITLSSSLISIGAYAFCYCYALTSVTLPSSLTTIDGRAFYDCTALQTVNNMENTQVTELGYAAFYNCTSLTSITLPPTMTNIGTYAFASCKALPAISIPANVTIIGDYAFQSCYLLESVDMKPATMTSIGRNAFDDCRVLKAFRVPEGVTTLGQSVFWGCKALETLTFPSTLTSLGLRVCYNCSSLTSITLPDALTTIGETAFYQCSNLTSINIPANVESIGSQAFYNCKLLSSDITLPATLTSLGTYAFYGCESVEHVTFLGNNDVTLPGESQFSMMKGLKSVRLPEGQTLITRSMFYGCSLLESVNLSSTHVTEIRPYAFYENKSLTTMEMPATLTTIGEHAFRLCESLTTINFPAALTTIGNEAFRNTRLTELQLNNGLESIGQYAFADSKDLSASPVVIPQSVTSIGNAAFYNCDQLMSFTFPSQLTTFGQSMLENCDNLQTVVFPKNLTTIPKRTCQSCPKLVNIILPEDVVTIGESAFYENKSLPAITLPATMKTIEQNAFYNALMPTITLNEGLEKIGYRAFRNCDRLKEVTLPASLKQLNGEAFYDCDSLLTLTFADDATNLTLNGESHFNHCQRLVKVTLPKTGMTTLPTQMFRDCDRMRNIELPATLTSIGNYTFHGCDSLQTIYIPNGVTSIGNEAFNSCRALRYVRLPEGLESIGYSCFAYCEKLPYINIPSTMTSIGNYAIHTTATSSNTNFKSIGIMGDTMPGTSDHVFWQYQPAFSLLVPAGQESDYQNHPAWTPDATDNRTIKGYPAEKQTLTQDLIHLSCLDKEHYKTGSPESVWIDWFEGMGNYRIYYTDAKGNKTTAMPTENGEYTISVDFEEGPYYKPATFNNIATFALQEIANEDFALLWDFYSKTYDRTKQKSTWTGNGGGGAPANWGLIEGVKESAVGIFGVKWNNGHVEEINFGSGTSIYNLNSEETPVSLFALPQVKKIEIAGCELYGNISDKVEAWLASGKTLSPTLEYLDLQRNKLEGNLSTLANALPALKTLDLHENRFSTVWPALSETLENINISNQTITDIVATVDLRDMTEAGFFSTLPSIVFYDPDTRTYADNISIGVQSQTNWGSFTVNYNASNDFTITGNCTWKGASGDIAKCSYTDSKNKTTNFNANFFYDMGDVDFNGLLNISDLQQSINYLFKESYSGYSRYNFTAGDLNADNAINVLDIVPHVDMLLAQEESVGAKERRNAPRNLKSQPTTSMPEASLYVKDGKLILHAARPVAALDITLSGQVTIANHPFASAQRKQSDGKVHLIIYHLSGNTLPAGETVIATCEKTATISSAMLVDEEAQPMKVKLNDQTTGIQAIEKSPLTIDNGDIYTLDGRKVSNNRLPKGIYIVNGKKVVIK